MKKKLICLVMALVMLVLPFAMTSCEEEKAEVVDESERKEIYLTLYTITDEKTTEEGIERIQSALDEIIFNRYKAHVILKCFTPDEYEKQLNKLYDEFKKLEEKEREDAAKEKEEEKKRQEAEKDLTKAEKRKLEQERKKAAEEEKLRLEEEEAARLERIKNGEEDPINGPQLDLFYLPSAEDYYTAIGEERLLPLDSYLKVDYKEMFDYLSANLLTNATVAYDEEDAAIYGIPNNGVVAEEGWYYVFDTKLAEKYDFDLDGVPQFSVFAEYVREIAEKEPDVIPIANPAPANNVDFYNDIEGFPISVSNSEYGSFEARGVMQTYGENSALREHFGYMAEFREAGYFVDREVTEKDAFFMDIRQGSAEDAEAWGEAGYTVVTYRRPATKIDLCRSGFYAISSYCAEDYQERAMEVLMELYTNREVHNLFAFGQEGVDYTVNEDGITVKNISEDYVMDFATTGNTLLGYLPEGYPADYVEKARSINRSARLSGFSSFFMILDEDSQEWFDEILALEDDCTKAYAEMCYGKADWEETCNSLLKRLDSVDLPGFITEIVTPAFRSGAKNVRSADGANYSQSEPYYQSEYEALEQGGMLGKEEDTEQEETPAA